jgi:hypothetical protein
MKKIQGCFVGKTGQGSRVAKGRGRRHAWRSTRLLTTLGLPALPSYAENRKKENMKVPVEGVSCSRTSAG